MAYAWPPMAKALTSAAPPSASNPPRPSRAEPAGSRVPFPCTRISWTPSSRDDATTAYVPPPMPNASTDMAPPSMSKPPAPSAADLVQTASRKSGLMPSE